MNIRRIASYFSLIIAPTISCAQANNLPANVAEAYPLDGCVPPLQIVARGETANDLIKIAKPIAVWNDNLLWVNSDPKGQSSFVLGTPQWVQLGKAAPFWALIQWPDHPPQIKETDPLDSFLNVDIALLVAKLPLVPEIPLTQDGSSGGDFAILIGQDKQNNQIYELGCIAEISNSGSHIEEKRLFLLHRANGDWHFIGEGPREIHDWGDRYFEQASTYVAQFGGGKSASPIVHCTITQTTGEMNDPLHVPDLTLYREAILEGPLPASFHCTRDPYIRTEASDSLNAIAQRFARWNSSEDFTSPDSLISDTQRVLKMIEQLNPGRGGNLPESTIINIPAELPQHAP